MPTAYFQPIQKTHAVSDKVRSHPASYKAVGNNSVILEIH